VFSLTTSKRQSSGPYKSFRSGAGFMCAALDARDAR
jgi:hypothetical protein